MAKVLREYRVADLDGVKELRFGEADPEDRMKRDFSKTGKSCKPVPSRDDEKAFEKRLGLPSGLISGY